LIAACLATLLVGSISTAQAPSEQAPSEQAPSEQAPSEQAPSEQAPAEQAPAQQTPDTPSPAEETADEGTPAEQAAAPDNPPQPDATDAPESPAGSLRFSFSGTPWREVIQWVADEAGLALHVDSLPPGSFTYTDPSTFTHQEAIDRVNLFLLPQGYTLVRSGNLLSVINLSDPRSMEQLDALADLVRVDELDQRNGQDVVKCLFPLGALSADDAVEELSAIKLMTQPAVLSKTNQLLITDTVAKLKNVRAILDAFEPSALDNGTVVKSFELEHVEAEDVLAVARPHLGLATGEMIGIDISLSSDLQGKHIFATGIEDKVLLIERLVESIDVPSESLTSDDSEAILQAHRIAGGNVDLAYDVLQTLLAGQDIRISKDETAGTVVALAPPKIQQEIELTVAKLAAEEAAFEVIELNNVDPYVAISLIEQMLDLPDPYDDDRRRDDAVAAPKIDADPENGRLFVRAKPAQIEEIKKIVEGLDRRQKQQTLDSRIRLLSLSGTRAKQSLTLAARFWREPNPIVLFDSDASGDSQPRERVVHEDAAESDAAKQTTLNPFAAKTPPQFVSLSDRGRLLDSPKTDVKKPAIECQVTARGLLLQCEDVDALNQFQEHLEAVADSTSTPTAEPIVFYLKFTRPDEAIRVLAEMLDGGQAVQGSSDGLVNATSSSGSSFTTSFITNRDGTISLIAGSATVIADSRLNRLIVQGTPEDIDLIEGYLKVIEKESSLTSVETYGQTHVIELINTRASEVEAAIRQAFAGRVVESAANAGGQGGAPGGSRGRDEDRDRDRDGDRDSDQRRPPPKSASQQARDLEPKMTLAVHQQSNSLIVTAPDQLFQEVEALAKQIDLRGEQTIEVYTPSNSEVLEAVLEEVLAGRSTGRSSSRYSSRRRDRDR
jgi:type II secretory pathway component GspD/PulD (secretin)